MKNTRKNGFGIIIIAVVALVAATGAGAAQAGETLDWLKQGTNGNTTTGLTFDNSTRPQPSDAVPVGNVPSGVQSSTSTAGGFSVSSSTSSVDTSSSTATSPPDGTHPAN